MIIETNEYRRLIRQEIMLLEQAEQLALCNKRYSVKSAVLVVQGLQSKSQIICGSFASFRSTTYTSESGFHPEQTLLDSFSDELDNITLYVAKLNIRNEVQPSRPCRYCMGILNDESQIHAIVYRDDKLSVVKEVLE